MVVQISGTVRNAKLVSKSLEDFTKKIPQISAGRLYGRLISARKRITTYPDFVTPHPYYEPNGPHKWASRKQQMYVMMMIKRGEITVPYPRTGTYGSESTWKVVKVENGYMLRGVGKYVVYVSGDAMGKRQARIHKGRWLLARTAVEEAMRGLPKELIGVIRVSGRKIL
jgi:hypothetical protein